MYLIVSVESFATLPTNAFDIADLNEPINAYDNGKIYSVGSIVKLNGNIYKMVDGTGAAGYSPERPGDKAWERVKTTSKMSNTFNYRAPWYIQ